VSLREQEPLAEEGEPYTCTSCGQATATVHAWDSEVFELRCEKADCGYSWKVSREASERLSHLVSQPYGSVPLDTSLSLEEFLERDLPPRRWIVEGLLQERDTAMLHSFRGVGKSRFAHGVACAVTAGEKFLRYVCPEPRGVLLVDGELPAEELQKMLLTQVSGWAGEPVAPFKILAADVVDEPLQSLATPAGQQRVEASLQGIDLVILDNISTLCGGLGPENDAESWEPVQEWLLRLRRRGLTVLLVHHEGKSGRQRGTSKREDVLSQVLQLRRPANYSPAEGCRFEVHLTKARGVYGEAATPFEARFQTDASGQARWSWGPLVADRKERILELAETGVTNQRAIAQELGVSPATVNRAIQALRADGRWREAVS
jgi:hypothetical protein